eukprot:m.8039 g.8039  ORF g.8039 m.8039 type:complete len:926 (+) comp3825_c0_seq1:173-2950(+)
MLTVLSAALFAALGESNDKLCFDIELQGTKGTKSYPFSPVRGFPPNHALVKNKICEFQAKAGDPIPHRGQWLRLNKCEAATSSQMFYAYGKGSNSRYGIQSSSTNSGVFVKDAALLYFVVDDADEMTFAVSFDIPGDDTGGKVVLSVEANDLRRNNITFDVRDDENEPVCSYGLCQWDQSASAVEDMTFEWADCCTDGFALAGIPDQGVQFPFKFTIADGIDKFLLATWDTKENPKNVSFITLSKDEVLSSGMTVRALSCSQMCSSKKTCGTCSQDPRCSWCGDTKSCLPISSEDLGLCNKNSVVTDKICCQDCTALTTQSSCLNKGGCAWDTLSRTCLSGIRNLADDEVLTCRSVDDTNMVCFADDAQCNVCGGYTEASNGGESVKGYCSLQGTCDLDTGRCTCFDGYGGQNCEKACENNCSGNGQCDKDSGECVCDCGYGGNDCSKKTCSDNCDANNKDTRCLHLGVDDTCSITCGRRVSQNKCTGNLQQKTNCQCLPGWWGPECISSCPGVNKNNGLGSVCGGLGTCNKTSGSCICAACNIINQKTGICQPMPDPKCKNFGQPICSLKTGAKECKCIGNWGGPLCDVCQCPGSIKCNKINGECDYTVCDYANNEYQLKAGSLAGDTECRQIRDDCDFSKEYEASEPTRTSDRICQSFSACENFEFLVQEPTRSTDRICASTTTITSTTTMTTKTMTVTTGTQSSQTNTLVVNEVTSAPPTSVKASSASVGVDGSTTTTTTNTVPGVKGATKNGDKKKSGCNGGCVAGILIFLLLLLIILVLGVRRYQRGKDVKVIEQPPAFENPLHQYEDTRATPEEGLQNNDTVATSSEQKPESQIESFANPMYDVKAPDHDHVEHNMPISISLPEEERDVEDEPSKDDNEVVAFSNPVYDADSDNEDSGGANGVSGYMEVEAENPDGYGL